jgi:hypothetical protein
MLNGRGYEVEIAVRVNAGAAEVDCYGPDKITQSKIKLGRAGPQRHGASMSRHEAIRGNYEPSTLLEPG